VTKEGRPVNRNTVGQKVLLSLTEEQWLDLLDRLTLFTNSHYFGIDGRDSIQEAILAVMAGRRSWDVQKTPFHNLCLIIRSVTSNQLAKDKKFVPLDDKTEIPAFDIPLIPPLNLSHTEAYEQHQCDENFRSWLRKSLDGDEMSRRVADYLIEDNSGCKTGKIAEALGEEKKEVNNARRRLMRKLRVLIGIPKRVL